MFKFIIIFGALIFPLVSFAQRAGGAKEIIQEIGSLVNLSIPIAAALALVYFFWGLAKFILNAGSEEGQESGKNVMKWGIVALFVMVSIWGIVGFIRSEFGITDIVNIQTPGL